MDSIAESYTSTLHEKLKFFASWPNNMLVQLGDYGTLQGALFAKTGNLGSDFNINIVPDIQSGAVNNVFEHKSGGIKEIQLNADASTIQADACVRLEFGSANSLYFKALKSTYSGLKNRAEVDLEILRRYNNDLWDAKLVVVISVIKATATTILISEGKGASVEISGRATTTEGINLVDASAGLSIRSDKHMGLKILASNGLTPLFGLARVKPRTLWEFIVGKDQRIEQGFFGAEGLGISGDVIPSQIAKAIIKDSGKSLVELFEFSDLP